MISFMVRQVLVLYLERPATEQCAGRKSPRGALLIQRLEGSRPQGSLCILNGAEGGRCVDELVVICADCRLDVGTELGGVA
jgi:hypothetical protein